MIKFEMKEDKIKPIFEIGAKDLNIELYNAVISNNIIKTKLMFDCGADGYTDALKFASAYGYINIVKLILHLRHKGVAFIHTSELNHAEEIALIHFHVKVANILRLEVQSDIENLI